MLKPAALLTPSKSTAGGKAYSLILTSSPAPLPLSIFATLTTIATITLVLLATSFAFAAPNITAPPSFEEKLVAVEQPQGKTAESCLNCFFKKGATDDMFSGRAELAPPPAIQILRPISGQQEDVVDEAEAQALAPRNKIARDFGPPEEDDQILGDEKAPKAFKGMMAALESGDKDLAFKYARRYTRYINKLKDRTLLVTKLAGLGAEIEGYRPRLDHSEESDPSGYLDIYEKQLDETVKNESAILSLNPDAQAMLAMARQEEQASGAAAGAQGANGSIAPTQPLGEAAERALVYKNHRRPLPVDPQGRVNLIFFLSSADIGPHSMIGDIQRLKDRYEKDDKVVIKGVSLVPEVNQITSTMQRYGLKITFPIEEHRELATELGITHTPAVVVMASTTGDYVLEKGHRTIWYLEELISAVRGKSGQVKLGQEKSGQGKLVQWNRKGREF
jgi:hypothetical protein